MAKISYVVGSENNLKKVNLKREAGGEGNKILELPLNGHELATVADLSGVVLSKAIFIERPYITPPISGTSGFRGIVKLTPYLNSTSYIGECSFTEVQIANDILFTDIINTNKVAGEQTEIFVEPTVSGDTIYVRVRHHSALHMSDWSPVVTVIVGQLEYILKPSITTPVNNKLNNLLTLYIASTPYTLMGATDSPHTSTEYQIANDEAFTDIYFEEVSTTDLEFNVVSQLLLEDSTYYIRLRYLGSKYPVSEWTDVVKITTYAVNIDLGEDENQLVLAGNPLDGAYFGEIPFNKLVGDYNYRGPYKAGTTFKATWQVSHGDKLWKAVVDTAGVTPGTDITKWVEDTRENLPTGKWLLDEVGIGYGLSDGNNDGYSSGSASIGALKNASEPMLKFAYDNKLFYVSKKPLVSTIAWTDIARRMAVYGDRTVRIGSRLYYVRLLSEEEYTTCLVGLTNGTLASLPAANFALSENTLITDTREGANRYVMSGTGPKSNVATISRTCSYRPVLELIPVGEEPYNNLPLSPTATAESFQFDKYTDTGYFGIVPASNILTGSALAARVGLSAGVPQYDTEGYLKFYWHGKILFYAKKSFRYNLTWDSIKAANVMFGVDMGSNNRKNVVVGDFNFNVSLMIGSGKSPTDDVAYWGNWVDPSNTTGFLPNVALEIGKGSMWNDLMYRVHTTVVDGVLANQDDVPDHKTLTGGVQIGNNWANMTSIDLNIYYANSGNGTAVWTPETSTVDSTHRVHRAYHRVAYSHRGHSTDSHVVLGWRPLLVLGK